MLLAADYPFLDILWSMIIFFAWVAWIWMLFIILADVFRRRDIGGWGKAGWCVFMIVLPFVGVLSYLILHHDDMAERRAQDITAQQSAIDEHIRKVATSGNSHSSGGPASEIESAKRLLDQGVIDEAEFRRLKDQALAAH